MEVAFELIALLLDIPSFNFTSLFDDVVVDDVQEALVQPELSSDVTELLQRYVVSWYHDCSVLVEYVLQGVMYTVVTAIVLYLFAKMFDSTTVAPAAPAAPVVGPHVLFQRKYIAFSSLRSMAVQVMYENRKPLPWWHKKTKRDYWILSMFEYHEKMFMTQAPHIYLATSGALDYIHMSICSAYSIGGDVLRMYREQWGPEALWSAVDVGDYDIVNFLIGCGIDPTIKTEHGKNYSAMEHMAAMGEVCIMNM